MNKLAFQYLPHVNIAQFLVLKKYLAALEDNLCSKKNKAAYELVQRISAKATLFEWCDIPEITMAVAGSHVKIIAPKTDKHLFYNIVERDIMALTFWS